MERETEWFILQIQNSVHTDNVLQAKYLTIFNTIISLYKNYLHKIIIKLTDIVKISKDKYQCWHITNILLLLLGFQHFYKRTLNIPRKNIFDEIYRYVSMTYTKLFVKSPMMTKICNIWKLVLFIFLIK